MKNLILRTLILMIFGWHAAVYAELEEIVVTSEFRPTTLQTLAASISVLNAELTERRGAQHLEELIGVAPNVNFSSGSSRARYYQIRGIGERSQFAEPINPSVGFIVDEIDFSGIGTAGTLFDVDNVEVLRGPQGTLYGANALAGLIRVNTNIPDSEPGLKLQTQVADFDTWSVGVAGNVDLIEDQLVARIAVQQYESDGFIENTFLNRDDTNGRDEFTARVRLRWQPSDTLLMDTSIQHIDIDNGYDAFSLDNDRFTRSDEPGRDEQETTAISVKTTLTAAAGYDVETILTYADTDLEYSFDEDWTFTGFDPIGYTSFDQYLRDRENYSAELRLLSSSPAEIFSKETDWVFGVYHLSRDEDLLRRYTFIDGDFESSYDTSSTAVYTQLNTALSNKLSLGTGLRVEQWQADYSDSNGTVNDPDETLFGGKLSLNYQYSDDQLMYASISRGYKAGGTNNDGSLQGTGQPLDFDTEFLWSFESGMKSSWYQDTLQSRVSVFYAKRKDQQVKSSVTVPIPDTPGAVQFIDLITNAASGENFGLEAELDWQPNQAFTVNASLGLLEATFDEYFAPPTQADPEGLDLSGEDQAHAPSYQFSLGAEYQFANGLFVQGNIEGKDSFFFSDRHRAAAESFELLNARIGYRSDNWNLSLWARNLGDEDYTTRGFGSFGNDPRNFYEVGTFTQLGEPRMVGLSFNLEL